MKFISEKSKKSILLIEKKKKFTHDKNWCFWNTPKNLFTEKFDTAWDSIRIIIDKYEIITADEMERRNRAGEYNEEK